MICSENLFERYIWITIILFSRLLPRLAYPVHVLCRGNCFLKQILKILLDKYNKPLHFYHHYMSYVGSGVWAYEWLRHLLSLCLSQQDVEESLVVIIFHCRLKNMKKANKILIISKTINFKRSKIFPYRQVVHDQKMSNWLSKNLKI